MPDSGILQIYRIHQMMQCDVRIAATHARQHRSEQTRKSNQWIAAKCAEEKIEPHHVRFQLPKRTKKPDSIGRVVK
jgi:hypothetical protein